MSSTVQVASLLSVDEPIGAILIAAILAICVFGLIGLLYGEMRRD